MEWLNEGRLLALDVGDKRVGVAVSDELRWFARPLSTFTRRSKIEDYALIARWVNEQAAVGVIVGHPLNTDGSAGPQAQRVARYARGLAQHLQGESVPLLLWDERFSTEVAQERMIAAGRSAEYRRAHIDEAAAAVILQSYLDAQRRDSRI